MSIISSTKSLLLSIRWAVCWHLQYFAVKLRELIPTRLKSLELCDTDNVLIIVPHADDEWIGCYSVLSKKKKGITCCYLNMYGNDYSEENIKKRTSEINASAKFWGFKLDVVANDSINVIMNIIKSNNVCFVPSPYDWHPEHRKAFSLFYEAYSMMDNDVKKNVQVYYYSVSVPHSKNEELKYLPLNKQEVESKWSDFQNIYSSQSFMPSVRYKLQLRLVPKKVGYAAQCFVQADKKRLAKDYALIGITDITEALNQSSHDIYNILKSRSIVDKVVYNEQYVNYYVGKD